MEDAKDADCIIVAVAHEEFKKLSVKEINQMYVEGDSSEKVLVDVKGLYNKKEVDSWGYRYWRL